MSAGHITAYLSFGAAQTGVWCGKCLLPSAVAYDVHLMTHRGVFAGAIHCTTCDQCQP